MLRGQCAPLSLESLLWNWAKRESIAALGCVVEQLGLPADFPFLRDSPTENLKFVICSVVAVQAEPSRFAPPCRLVDLTFPEATTLRAAQPVVLLPMGSVEHTDRTCRSGPIRFVGIPGAVGAEAATPGTDAVGDCPNVKLRADHFASEFAGGVAFRSSGNGAAARGCRSVLAAGFSRICLVSSHLEPAHIQGIRTLVSDLCTQHGPVVAFPDQTAKRWARTLSAEYKSGSCHAGSYETSLLLVARPDLCRNEIAQQLPNNPSDFWPKSGPVRRPSARRVATARISVALPSRPSKKVQLALLTQMVVTTIAETWPKSS